MRKKERNKPMRKNKPVISDLSIRVTLGLKVFRYYCFQYLCLGGKKTLPQARLIE